MTLIIAGLFYDPALEAFPDDKVLHGFCCADSLGSTITAEGGLKIASTHRRKIHALRPEVHVPNYQSGRLEAQVRRSIIPLGLAHAGNVYLTSTILTEFLDTLQNLRATRGNVDQERKLVPPWHPDALNQSPQGDDPHLWAISPRSNMDFFAQLLQINARSVLDDAKEVYGPGLHAGIDDVAFVLLGYCEMKQRVVVYHFDLLRSQGEAALPTVQCRELAPGQIAVLGLPPEQSAIVEVETTSRAALSSLSDAAEQLCAEAIAGGRFKGVGGYLTEGHVKSSIGFHMGG